MKRIFICVTLIILNFCSSGQTRSFPLKESKSVLFGKDIIINNKQYQNQQYLAICSAFNGWLYAGYSCKGGSNGDTMAIMISKDSGITWSELFISALHLPHDIITKLSIVVAGNDISNIKIFLGIIHFDTVYNKKSGNIWRFNGETGAYEASIFPDETQFVHDLVLSSDYLYPALNSSPYSIAVLYTRQENVNIESLKLLTSSNGGLFFDYSRQLTISSNYHCNLALTYGRSLTKNSGQYFAAWEEKENSSSTFGHIYSSHSEPNFNSPFTAPKNLDSLDLSAINKCRKPSIACQYNNADNDSSNLTEIIVCEKFIEGTNNFDLVGFYNVQAATSSYFKTLNISSTLHNEIQSDIAFNPYNSKFIVTYFDSTNQNLPMITNDFNLSNPDSWLVISSAYNDSNNLINPNPKIIVNFDKQAGANCWISSGSNANGKAMFDAQYSTWTGISQLHSYPIILHYIYPNPCKTMATIEFELKQATVVSIKLYQSDGKFIKNISDGFHWVGKSKIYFDLSNYSTGSYIYSISTHDYSSFGKFTILK